MDKNTLISEILDKKMVDEKIASAPAVSTTPATPATIFSAISSLLPPPSPVDVIISTIEPFLDAKIIESDKKIVDGLAKETASTGTPISQLKGAAKFTSQLSNIGEGSKESGGGGMQKGLDTIRENDALKVYKASLELTKNLS